MKISQRDRMGGLAKGLAVIETFTADRPRQAISGVASASGFDRATARRCLLTLAELGYADYDGKFFTLTPRVLRLGTACLAAMPLPQLVQPWLDGLSEELGESTSVSILDEDEIVYVARAARRKVMSISLMPGSRLPAYCTSMGRVLLSALPEAEIRRRLAIRPLAARTALTVTDCDAVMARVETVRDVGYAVVDQEVEVGLWSIAVPLLNTRGDTVAAMNFGLAAGRTASESAIARYLPALRRIQAEIGKILR